MTRIEVKREFEYDGKVYEPGEAVDLPESVAKSVVDRGYAEEADRSVPKIGAEETEGSGERPESGGVDVGGYMTSGGWLTAEEVDEGDTITITGSGRMDDTFEQEYLVVPVEYDGQNYNLRLGKRNTRRIAESYGKNTKDWSGMDVEVASIEDYQGLGTKGMVLKPAE